MPRSGSYVVLDFETTGLSPRRREVVETGAVHVDGGRLGATFEALTRPALPIPARVTAVHGIDDSMVAGRPHFTTLVPELLEFLEGRVLVAHHARFDCAFLDAAVDRVGLPRPENRVLDTVRLSRRFCPELDRHDLSSLCVAHRIRRARAHRALDDAVATAELLVLLLERAEEEGVGTTELFALGRPGAWRRGRRPRGPVLLRPEEVERLEEAVVTGDRLALETLTVRGNRRRRTVVPYLLEPAGAVPRIVAYDVDAGVTRIWPLDRVIAVEPAEGTA
jgi:DNA polymerase III epsilon subunit family exonuclease